MSRPGPILLAGILTFSTISTLAGIAALFTFDQTAGAVSAVPVRWPDSSVIRHFAPAGDLLVFVHPYCSCSVATVHEIAGLNAARKSQPERPSITILFYRPKNSQWKAGNLWRQVERELPVARAVWDDDGREAARFGARTSGFTLLYNTAGKLLFKGGVTGSRGHVGDNLGLDRLRTSLDTGTVAPRTSLVFGCALAGAGAPPPGEEL